MKRCPVCEHSSASGIYGDSLLRCEACCHVWANLTLSENDLRNLYAENYFKGEEYADYVQDKEIIQRNFRKRLSRSIDGHSAFEHVLEIGCAYGFFGEVIQQDYPKSTYKGFDISEDAIAHAKHTFGLDVTAMPYLDTPAVTGFYSDVFMWDVIEHLSDPGAFIAKAAREMKADGRIYITTGDIGSWLARKQKEKWRMIHPPTHLHFFTQQSVRALLGRFGLEVEAITYPSVSRSMRVIYYSLFMLNKNPCALVRRVYKLIPPKAAVSLNTWDIMFVVARKHG